MSHLDTANILLGGVTLGRLGYYLGNQKLG